MRKRIIFLIIICLFSFLFLGGSVLAANHYPVTITNFNEQGEAQTITFSKKPERVITTNQPPTELLLKLGLEDYMVGTAWLDNPILPELKEKYQQIPVLADRYPAKEIVIAKNPDLIIGWKSVFAANNLGSTSSWKQKGVKTFIQRNSGVKEKSSLENVFKDIRDLAKIFAVEKRAAELIEPIEAKIDYIAQKTKAKEPVKVLILESSGNNKYRAYGQNSLVNDLVEKAGGENLVQKKANQSYGPENIIAKNPDVIISIYYLEQNQNQASLANNKVLANVKAIKDKRIVNTPLAETYAGGIRTINSIDRFAQAFYPELFE